MILECHLNKTKKYGMPFIDIYIFKKKHSGVQFKHPELKKNQKLNQQRQKQIRDCDASRRFCSSF